MSKIFFFVVKFFQVGFKFGWLTGWFVLRHLKYSGFIISYLPTPPLGQDMTQGQFLSGV